MPIDYGNLNSGLVSKRKRLLIGNTNNESTKIENVIKKITVVDNGNSSSFIAPVKDIFSKKDKTKEVKSKTKDAYVAKVTKLRF